MDLKEFITETVSSILDSVTELQENYQDSGHLVAPALNSSERKTVLPDPTLNTARVVEDITFDVAVTASSEKTGGGKAGIKVLSLELGGGLKGSSTHESISRVQFKIPLVLDANSDLQSLEGARRARRVTKTTVGKRGRRDGF